MSKKANILKQLTFGIKSNKQYINNGPSQNSSQDPYQSLIQRKTHQTQNILNEKHEKISSWKKKTMILKNRGKIMLYQARNGFLMGCLIGGSMGFLVGLPTAIKNRSFLILPASIVISGISFGIFLGCGSIIRSYDLDFYLHQVKQNMKSNEQFQNNQSFEIQSINPINSIALQILMNQK